MPLAAPPHGRPSLNAACRAALAGVFSAYDEIEAVYMFGSVAAGTAQPGSDLGIWRRHDSLLHQRKLDVLTDLTRQGVDDVDLAFLNRADPVVQYEAVRLNRLVYQTDSFDRGYVYSKVLRTYLDFLPYLRRLRDVFVQFL